MISSVASLRKFLLSEDELELCSHALDFHGCLNFAPEEAQHRLVGIIHFLEVRLS